MQASGTLRSAPAPIPGPELVIGLVGAAGLDLDAVASNVARALREVAYSAETISLSALLHRVKWDTPLGSRDDLDRADYITKHQDRGDELRAGTKRGDILALLAIAAIRVRRAEGDQAEGARRYAPSSQDESASTQQNMDDLDKIDPYRGLKRPLTRYAYILRSLKHPDEARTLRDVYGERFVLIGAYADPDKNIADLTAAIAHSKSHTVDADDRRAAEEIIDRDQADPENEFGQNVRATYPLADCFLDVSNEELLHVEASRFIEVLFSSPYQTPRRDEFGMFVAHAASLRSAALGRQVGASILDETGAVLAVGTNEVPKAGGGQYWVNDPYDYRDHRYEDGSDSSDIMRRAIIGELLERYNKFGIARPVWMNNQEPLTIDDLVPILKGTRIGNLVEFGRAVHAEMAAVTDAARRGVSIAGGTLYSTTFPCHNCARHLVAAGIHEVVYVEPYAKSLAMNLHRDAIALSSDSENATRIPFRQFIGVSPRRYAQLFTMVERKDELGYRLSFRPEDLLPRDVDLQAFYQHREARAIVEAGKALGAAAVEMVDNLLTRAVYD